MKSSVKQRLVRFTGGLGKPSKMPCRSYGISAKKCITGSKDAKSSETPCAFCYADKGNYVFKSTVNAHASRYASMQFRTQWTAAIIQLIALENTTNLFRWHDSGDLQSVDHLADIVFIARALPFINFWLPTREVGILAVYASRHGFNAQSGIPFEFPSNLCIRISSRNLDDSKLPAQMEYARLLGCQMSSVSTTHSKMTSSTCPAYIQGGKCHGDKVTCSDCWNKKHELTIYPIH